jgi:limonene-1,2-epoxide hydrolase
MPRPDSFAEDRGAAEVALGWLEMCEASGGVAAFERYGSDDYEFEILETAPALRSSFPPIVGKVAGRAIWERQDRKGTFKAEVRNWAVNGNIVFVERLESHLDLDGNVRAIIPVVQVMEVEGNRFTRVREYWDGRAAPAPAVRPVQVPETEEET